MLFKIAGFMLFPPSHIRQLADVGLRAIILLEIITFLYAYFQSPKLKSIKTIKKSPFGAPKNVVIR